MTPQDVIDELRSLGSPSIKKTLIAHGAREPFFGVKVADLKKIQKRVKVDHPLALALYDTGISDAMYLAGLIADDPEMTRADLQRWAEAAYWPMLSEATVPWVASGNALGREMALEWIESPVETIAAAGWSTLACIASTRPDAQLDLAELDRLIARVEARIQEQPNRVRYAMNGFVIGVGCYVAPLTDRCLEAGARLGEVRVDMGGTDCKVPSVVEYISKVQMRGTLGKKRKTAKC